MPIQSTVSDGSSAADNNLIATEMPSSSIPADALPDAPMSQDQSSGQNQQAPQRDQTQTHINLIPLLPPKLVAGTTLTAHDKWEIYYHKTYSPAAVIYPLFGAGIKMANPKKGYPEEWQDGMGAFGRNYGNMIAQRTARSTADFSTQMLFHEDPRYQRSDSKNPLLRVGHALVWTFVDKSDSGNRTFALSTFTSSAAGGFVGMAYLPDGYNDVTHAEQRMAMEISGRAISNVLTEFEPIWGPWAAKLRIPKILPDWWVPQSKP
ncbi:hypothetical protein GCM10011586_14820 [Silvibacterium dinghuense]|nr:hypothetical protein GCM10011586_14820 [Silvibacterium dinghuense]